MSTIERQFDIQRLSDAAAHSANRIFFGGSFDPPHIAHIELPVTARDLYQPGARLIFVPAARSPHKDEKPTEDSHRLAMLGCAIESVPDCEIWCQELHDAQLNPGQPSFWADTWMILQSMGLPGVNKFIIGADQAISIHRWRRFEEFWRHALVLVRDHHDSTDSLIASMQDIGIWSQEELSHWRSQVLEVPIHDVSSTQIRSVLSDPAQRKNPIAGLDDRVHQYILDHGLYRPNEDRC